MLFVLVQVAACFPAPVAFALRSALRTLRARQPAVFSEALVVGVETRTSAPLRVTADRLRGCIILFVKLGLLLVVSGSIG